MDILNKVFIALSLLIFISCETDNPEPVLVQGVSLNATSMELTEGQTATLVATVSPSNAENKTVTWITSNESVARVIDGMVIAMTSGKATITVKTDDGGKTASCEVTVIPIVTRVESVSLDRTSATLTEGEELTLTATINPDNASNKNVTWTSSDSSIASVTDGKVTALKAGSATITVKTEDGAKTACCEVKVAAKGSGGNNEGLDENTGRW
jgi:uncharacterized protein YjdB